MSITSKLDFFLITLKPVTVFTGRVNGAPTDPFMTITWDAGATGTASTVGTSGAPVAGNTVWFGSTPGGQERGTVRLRSWTPSDPTGTAGSLSIAETDDVGPQIQNNDYITVKLEWRLWPIAPRLVQRGTEVEFYEDYDIGYDLANKQTVNWRPIAVAGPPAVEYLSGPTQASFIGDRSIPLAPGATITNWLWTAHGSVEGTSAAQGTEGAPVVFTWNAAGQYLVSLRVTDSNGNTHTTYPWVFIVDPDNPTDGPGVYTEFDSIDDNMDFFQGGGESSFTVHGVADVGQFPREAMVIHAARGSQATPTGSWPFRTDNLFTGYVVGDSIRQDSVHDTTSFRAATIDGLMKNLSMHAVSLRDTAGPTDWTMASDITVDRAMSFLALYRSTLAQMTPIRPLNYTAEIKRQDFSPSNLYQQLQGELVKDAWAQVVSDHQGVLHLVRDYNLMDTTERAAVTERKLLHKGIWLDPLDIEERPDYAWPVRKVEMSGILYLGADTQPVPYFSEAPGDVHKAFGRDDTPGRLILSTQADLNIRCGLSLARQIQRWHTVRGRLVNDGSFTIAPQEIFPANVEAADNNRGLSWTPDLIPRRIRRSYNHEMGTYTAEVEFEPSATGPAGETVIMPSGPGPPRTPTMPRYDPPPVPAWTPPIISDAGAAVAADGALGVFWSLDKGATWERRVNGLATGATGTSQIAFQDLIWDPWWFTPQKKGTDNPEEVILWGCGRGFIVRSPDAGRNWQDMTPYLDDPPDDWSDSPPPTVADLTYRQIHADIHNIDTFYVVAEWQNSSGDWRGWILKSADDGITWTWGSLRSYIGEELVVNGTFDADCASWTICGANGVFWSPQFGGSCRMAFRALSDTFTNQNVNRPSAGTYRLTATFNRNAGYTRTAEVRMPVATLRLSWPNPDTGTKTVDIALGAGTSTLQLLASFFGGGGTYGYYDNVSLVLIATAVEARPLAIDVDTEDGSRIYITSWIDGSLRSMFFDSDLTSISSVDFGPATADEPTAKTYFVVPRTPHFPSVADFGDIVYVFGRWDDGGTARHVARSTDGGATFTTIGDASWTTERVGALSVLDSGATIYAFLNSASPALWRSIDGGATWAQINTLPFNTEYEAVSRHGGAAAEFLIGNNAAEAEMAAFLETPYTNTWIGATGPAGQRLPVAADGGSNIASIIWI